MGKHICILQTSFAKRDDIVQYLKSRIPDLTVSFITDDTLLADTRRNNGPTASVYGRMTLYARAAELKGADVILNSCTSVGTVADNFAKTVSIPVVRIDGPMCEEAIGLGSKFALLSTVNTSAYPIRDKLIELGSAEGKTVSCELYQEQSAWDALTAGKPEEHNRLLLEKIALLDTMGYDAIVMTQVSMRALLPALPELKTPVLCCFESGLNGLIKVVESL